MQVKFVFFLAQFAYFLMCNYNNSGNVNKLDLSKKGKEIKCKKSRRKEKEEIEEKTPKGR